MAKCPKCNKELSFDEITEQQCDKCWTTWEICLNNLDKDNIFAKKRKPKSGENMCHGLGQQENT